MFNHLNEAIKSIETRVKFRPKTDLIIMQHALEIVDLDLSKIKKIHVAGTNGKGSTSSFLTHILMEQGLRVGTFTSPYLVKFNERIRFNFESILDTELLTLINKAFEINEKLKQKYQEELSFFELLTIMALIYFKEKECDVIVMEVGLGGLLDATNVLEYDVSLITNIGFDHMKQLGNTLEEIALNKLGILKPNGHLITTVDSTLKTLFINYANNKNASINLIDQSMIKTINQSDFLYKNEIYSISLLGDYQRLNASLAIEAILYLYPNIDLKYVKNGLKSAIWAGRLEKINDFYIDGAHNEHAIKALKRNLKEIFKDKKIYIIFSALKDKDIAGMIDLLKDELFEIILTSFPDFRFESLIQFETNKIKYIEDFLNAYDHVQKIKKNDDIIIVTGSLHFIGYVKSLIK